MDMDKTESNDMPPDAAIPPLRMAPPETAADLALRWEREDRAKQRQRESNLEHSLSPFRVGSVPFLNAVPLTRGLEQEVVFATPAMLSEMLRQQKLDAALVSITESLFSDRYDVLDGIAIASLGEVKSVFLAHRRPLDEIDVVHCDPASLTSVCLLKVLLAERGLHPEFKTLAKEEQTPLPDYAMLIGDRALNFVFPEPAHEVWDLGAAWYELTGLPFVYAAWALRRGQENIALRRQLREAMDFGLDTLDYIIGSRTEYSYDFRKDYLSWHVHFHLGMDEKRGITRFVELLNRHHLGAAHEPSYLT